jgi:uncharacterized membrane protein YphA (DoxX/SURF4 family)
MNIVLWILQVLLAIAFATHGWLFLSPPAEMVEAMNASISPTLRIFIGLAEVLAAIGLVAPGMVRVRPILMVLAGVGLMIVLASATFLHVWRGETGTALTTLILFMIISLVTYMRWKIGSYIKTP